jgi:hypothetical protein
VADGGGVDGINSKRRELCWEYGVCWRQEGVMHHRLAESWLSGADGHHCCRAAHLAAQAVKPSWSTCQRHSQRVIMRQRASPHCASTPTLHCGPLRWGGSV